LYRVNGVLEWFLHIWTPFCSCYKAYAYYLNVRVFPRPNIPIIFRMNPSPTSVCPYFRQKSISVTPHR